MELQLWEADSGLSESFKDIEELAKQCQFRNCSHHNEPNCAVKAAVQSGDLDEKDCKATLNYRGNSLIWNEKMISLPKWKKNISGKK